MSCPSSNYVTPYADRRFCGQLTWPPVIHFFNCSTLLLKFSSGPAAVQSYAPSQFILNYTISNSGKVDWMKIICKTETAIEDAFTIIIIRLFRVLSSTVISYSSRPEQRRIRAEKYLGSPRKSSVKRSVLNYKKRYPGGGLFAALCILFYITTS